MTFRFIRTFSHGFTTIFTAVNTCKISVRLFMCRNVRITFILTTLNVKSKVMNTWLKEVEALQSYISCLLSRKFKLFMEPKFHCSVQKNLDPTLNTLNTDSGKLYTVHWRAILIGPRYKEIFQVVSRLHVFRKLSHSNYYLQFQILSIHPSISSMTNSKIIEYRQAYGVICIGIS